MKITPKVRDRLILIAVLLFMFVLFLAQQKMKNEKSKTTTSKTEKTEIQEETQTSLELKGVGDDVKSVSLKKGLAVFTIIHGGERHFAVWLMDSQGNKLKLLVSEIGKYTGKTSEHITKSGTYLIQVETRENAAWGIMIR